MNACQGEQNKITKERKIRNILEQYEIRGLLMPIGVVAKVLGLLPSALYGHIRRDVFFMEYRRVGGRPMVEVEKFIEWYCTNPEPVVQSKTVHSDDEIAPVKAVLSAQDRLSNIQRIIRQTYEDVAPRMSHHRSYKK
jgi:hypothetical protein